MTLFMGSLEFILRREARGTPILLEECPLRNCFVRDGSARRSIEAGYQPGDVCAIPGQLRAAQWIGRDRFELEGIEPLAALSDAVIEMGPGGETGHSDIADHVALDDLRAFFQAFGEPGEMQVIGVVRRAVPDTDEVPLALFVAGLDYHAVGGRHHRRSSRRAVIDAVMRAEVLQNRMKATAAEARGDSRKLQWSLEELLAQRSAAASVVAGKSIRAFVTERFVGRAAMDEARRGDRPVADDVASREALADDEAERIALAKLEEIDVPLEHVHELLHELRTFAGVADRFIKGPVDGRGDGRLDLPHRGLACLDFESVGVPNRGDLAPAGDLHLHAVDEAGLIVVKTDHVAGAETANVDRFAELSGQERAFAAGQAARGQNAVERVVLFDGQDERVLRQLGPERLAKLVVAQLDGRHGGGRVDSAEFGLVANGGEEDRDGQR